MSSSACRSCGAETRHYPCAASLWRASGHTPSGSPKRRRAVTLELTRKQWRELVECPRCGGVANSRHACPPLTVEEAVALAIQTGERVELRDDDGRVTGVISAPNTPAPPGQCCEGYAATLRARVVEMGKSDTPTIYLFINSGHGTDWIESMAIAEDGTCLAGHVSSSESFAHHDIGHTSTWHHDAYEKHYPGGYRVEWVDDVRGHAGLMAAYRRNQERGAALDTGKAGEG